jgi:mercuric ion transport protein
MTMRDRDLTTMGIVGAVALAICCAMPLLAVAAGAVGLTAWLAKAGNVLIPALIVGGGLIGFGLYRKNRRER